MRKKKEKRHMPKLRSHRGGPCRINQQLETHVVQGRSKQHQRLILSRSMLSQKVCAGITFPQGMTNYNSPSPTQEVLMSQIREACTSQCDITIEIKDNASRESICVTSQLSGDTKETCPKLYAENASNFFRFLFFLKQKTCPK